MGYSIVSMYVTTICLCGVRITLLYLISKFNLDFKSVAYVYPMTWFCTASIFIIAFLKIINKKGLLQIDDFYHQSVTAFFFLQKK